MSKKYNEDISKKYTFIDQIKDLLYYSRPYKFQIIIYTIIILFISSISIFPIYITGKLIDYLTVGNFKFALFSLLAYFLIVFFADLFRSLMSGKIRLLSEKVDVNSRMKVYTKLLSLDYSYYEENNLGKIISKVNTRSIAKFLKLIQKEFLYNLFEITFIIIILFTIDWSVGILGIISLIFFIVFVTRITANNLKLLNNKKIISEHLHGIVLDFFNNILLVKVLNIKNNLLKLLKINPKKYIKHSKKSINYTAKLSIYSNTLFIFFKSLSFLLAIYLFYINAITLGTVVIISSYFSNLGRFLFWLWQFQSETLEYRSDMYRLSLLTNTKIKLNEPTNPKIISKDWNKIIFENVYFKYLKSKGYVIKNLNLDINRYSKIAIVGHSGSGKSTITKLLLKLYLVNRGNIKIGNIDLKDINSKNLYNIIKVVPQEDQLIDATIYQNLQYTTNRYVKKSEMISALKKADVWNFISTLPKKLNAVVGPNGVKLSGGQKQRICIARAILANPEILILDEATSNLDVITESKIHHTLYKNLSKDVTLIAVTHRIYSIKEFDRILVLHDGSIIGDGTHDELIKSNKYYKKLYDKSKKEDRIVNGY